ncbi:MAG TPA: MFS transporter [Candidatus Stackebrandtia faecavium]|nr:MFS transporter [Candidatus Stackebrandtia faecavium]
MSIATGVERTRTRERGHQGHPRRWAGLGVLCASLLIVVMDNTILNVALPRISTEVSTSSTQLLWMVDIYGLVVAGLLVAASSAADRYGRRRMLVVGYAVFGVLPLLVLVVSSAGGLIVLRGLLGIGGALIMPSTMSMIRDLFADAKERAIALGIWATMAAVGAGLGPIVGGFLVEGFGWRSAFLFNTPVMVVAILVAMWILPETRGESIPWDVLSTVLSILGVGAAMYAIKAWGRDGITDPAAWACTAISLVALGWFVRRCLRSRWPLLDLGLLRRRGITAGLIGAFVSAIAMAATLLLLAQWMQLVENYSPIETGIRLLPLAVVSGVLSPLAPLVAERIGVRAVMAGGLFVGGIGFASLYLGSDSMGYGLVAVSQSLVGISVATLAVGSAVILAQAPKARSGNAAAMEETSFQVGSAIGVAALGSIAAVMYRAGLSAHELTAQGITADQQEQMRESLGGAIRVAERLSDPDGVIASAHAAFIHGLGMAGLVGGLIMIGTAIVVWCVIPRGLTVEEA